LEERLRTRGKQNHRDGSGGKVDRKSGDSRIHDKLLDFGGGAKVYKTPKPKMGKMTTIKKGGNILVTLAEVP